MKEAITNSGRQNKEVARSIGLSPQGLSNYLNDPNREVPQIVVHDLVWELDDPEFKRIASKWWFDLEIEESGKAVIPTVALIKDEADDEQADRELLDPKVRRILRRDPDTWTSAEYQQMKLYRKEYLEEVSAEYRTLGAIDTALKRASTALQEVS
jgi:hypothetical protein